MKVEYYFAYGSNMNPERVAQRGLEVRDWQGARVQGLALRFDKCSQAVPTFGHANVRYDPTGCVEGLVYRLSDQDQILRMDPYERAPWNYGRDVVQVQTLSGPVWAWTYFANQAVIVEGLRPEADYLAHLLAGAEWLSAPYVTFLESFA